MLTHPGLSGIFNGTFCGADVKVAEVQVLVEVQRLIPVTGHMGGVLSH